MVWCDCLTGLPSQPAGKTVPRGQVVATRLLMSHKHAGCAGYVCPLASSPLIVRDCAAVNLSAGQALTSMLTCHELCFVT